MSRSPTSSEDNIFSISYWKNLPAFYSGRVLKILLVLIVGYIAIALLNRILLFPRNSTEFPIPLVFPINVFKLEFHRSGLLYAGLFLLVSVYLLRGMKSVMLIWIVGIIAIILSNLAQGDWQRGFILPFTDVTVQYYHDAIKILSPDEFLSKFNANQSSLLVHSKTHPPYAVLLHYYILNFFGGRIIKLSISFLLLACFSIPLVNRFLRSHVDPEKANALTVLFIALPAISIYHAVSYDAVVLAASLPLLIGVSELRNRRRIDTLPLLFAVVGLILANALNYGSIFFIGWIFMLGAFDYWFDRDRTVLIAGVILLATLIVFFTALFWITGYNHLAGFLTASRLENPNGFYGFASPLLYLYTRLQDVLELGLFFSMSAMAALISISLTKGKSIIFSDRNARVALAAMVVFGGMLLTGAYKCGETGRAAQYMYPFLLLPLASLSNRQISYVTFLAVIQTAGMQVYGYYNW